MGTTSTYFGGSGGGAAKRDVSTWWPLETKLTPLLAHPARYEQDSTNGPSITTWAGNPLGNGYSIQCTSYNSWNIRNNAGSTTSTLSPNDINSFATHIIGACYRSNGSIIFCAGDTTRIAFRSYNYNSSGQTPDGVTNTFRTVSSSAVGGPDVSTTEYKMAFWKGDNGNYFVRTNYKVYEFDTNFNIQGSWYSYHNNLSFHCSNRISVGVDIQQESSTDPKSMLHSISIRRQQPMSPSTDKGFNAVISTERYGGAAIHPLLNHSYWVTSMNTGYVGYDDETICMTGGYANDCRLDLNELKTYTDEFLTTYGRSYD